jgi:hypothetical protein
MKFAEPSRDTTETPKHSFRLFNSFCEFVFNHHGASGMFMPLRNDMNPCFAKPTKSGFAHEQLIDMQKIINAEKSDLFDVLAYVAYALPPLNREERATRAKVAIRTHFNNKQQAFLDFVLAHYVSVGVEELDQKKLTPLLKLKYHDSISDALADLGRPEEIGQAFAGFQKYLYEHRAESS